MHKRNEMEAAHQKHMWTLKITHLKEVALGDNGERSGELLVVHHLEGRRPLDQVGMPEILRK